MVFKKGNKPWNIGLNKEKDIRVKRNAENTSKTKRESGMYKGENNPMFGVHRMGKKSPHYNKPHSIETKLKLSKIAKERYKDKSNHPSFGKKRHDVSEKNKRNKNKKYEQIYGEKAEIIKYKIGNAQRGDKSHFWKGGKSFEPYTSEFNKELKFTIKSRDYFNCKICGKKNCELQIHHIDYDKKNNNRNNLIALCPSCHSITNFKRRSWEDALTCFMNFKDNDYNAKWNYINKGEGHKE